MVRRAAAKLFGEFASIIQKDILLDEMMPIYKKLVTDDQDTIRVLCLDALQ